MNVLIGVDDSPHAQATLNAVRRFPWPPDTRMIVASAVPPVVTLYPDVTATVPAMPVESVMDSMRQYHEDLARRAQGVLETAGFRTETLVEDGDPREVLLDAAKRLSIDLIVLGSHGRTGLAKLLMGSVATHVVTHASCNVLVVRRDAAATTPQRRP